MAPWSRFRLGQNIGPTVHPKRIHTPHKGLSKTPCEIVPERTLLSFQNKTDFIHNKGQAMILISVNFQCLTWFNKKLLSFPKKCHFHSHFWSGTQRTFACDCQEIMRQPSWICPLSWGIVTTRTRACAWTHHTWMSSKPAGSKWC